MSHSTASKSKDRSICVYISSTFADMNGERDALVGFAFPRLKKICEDRLVTWSYVDLRWGITESQKYKGEVLPICFREIDRCRPFFISLLGERYGWVPDEFQQNILIDRNLMGQFKGASITELEILYATRKDSIPTPEPLFYFRDPSYIDLIDPNERANFITDIKEHKERLFNLKQRIAREYVDNIKYYHSLQQLVETVYQDMKSAIDRYFPESDIPNSAEYQAFYHEVFASKRRKFYVSHNDYFTQLNQRISENNTPVVVFGESGSGKSALLANWCATIKKNENEFIIEYYIGASPNESGWRSVCSYILLKIHNKLDISYNPIKGDLGLKAAFLDTLNYAATRFKRIVLIVDGVNHLSGSQTMWIPDPLPSNINLILSITPCSSMYDLKRRGYYFINLKPFSEDDKKVFVKLFLDGAGKTLDDANLNKLLYCTQTSNPLFLLLLLTEISKYGDRSLLDSCILNYLAAENPCQLFQKILRRWEEVYDKGTDIVGKTMSLLYCANRGLSEIEILGLLKSKEQPFPHLDWLPFWYSAMDFLLIRSGLMTFGHNYLKNAVENTYLNSEQKKTIFHTILANYFESQPLGIRQIEELPWQYQKTNNWYRLKVKLCDGFYLPSMVTYDSLDHILELWTEIINKSDYSPINSYNDAIENPEKYNIYYLSNVAAVLGNMGFYNESIELFKCCLKPAIEEKKWDIAVHSLSQLSATLKNIGLFKEAADDANMAVTLSRQHLKQENLSAYLTLAHIYREQGAYNQARSLFSELEKISLHNEFGVYFESSAVYGLALIHKDLGELDNAINKCEIVLFKCKVAGNRGLLPQVLGTLGVLSRHRGEYKKSLEYHIQQEFVSRELSEPNQTCRALDAQAIAWQLLGDNNRAIELHRQEEEILKTVDDPSLHAIYFANKAVLLIKMGDNETALEYLNKAVINWKQLGNPSGAITSLRNIAFCLLKLGRENEAIHYANEVYLMANKYGLPLPPEFRRINI